VKLEELFEKKEGKGYSELTLDRASTDKVNAIVSEIGLKDAIDDFHTNLIYDVSNPDTDFAADKDKSYKAKVSGIKTLGEKGSKWYAIALLLKAPEIEDRHKD
jgi:hypothetical protein